MLTRTSALEAELAATQAALARALAAIAESQQHLAKAEAHLADLKNEPEELDRNLSAKEAARFLGLSERTVYLRAQANELPCVRIGGSVRFPQRALAAYVERHKQATA